MRTICYYLVVVSVAIALAGCTGGKSEIANIVTVDCGSFEEVDLGDDGYACLSLGVTDMVWDLIIHSDKVVIRFQDAVTAYSLENGDSLYSFSRKGRREDEFVSSPELWMKGDVLEMHDFNSKKLLRYDVNSGQYLGSVTDIETDQRFTILRWDRIDGYYIGVRTFTNIPVNDLAIYDEAYNFVESVDAPTKKSGIMIGAPIVANDTGQILYHPVYSNKIYAVKGSSLGLKYSIDFGENQISESFVESHPENEISAFFKEKENKEKFVNFTQGISESKDYLLFQYILDSHRYLAKYDKRSGKTEVFKFVFDNEDIPPALLKLFYAEGRVYVLVQLDEGTTLYTIPESDLK